MSNQENNPLSGLENVDRIYDQLEDRSRRTWMQGNTQVLDDISRHDAAALYRANWDDCRDLWKAAYGLRKWRRRGQC
jgi:hypothetical protein